MTFNDKLLTLNVPDGDRIVARIPTQSDIAKFYVVSKTGGLVWFYVWDNPKSDTDVKWCSARPPRSAKALSELEGWVRDLREKDLAGLGETHKF
jgi:hypothetical protein